MKQGTVFNTLQQATMEKNVKKSYVYTRIIESLCYTPATNIKLCIKTKTKRFPETHQGIWVFFENGCPELRRRQWHPTPARLPRKSHGQRSLVGCSPC